MTDISKEFSDLKQAIKMGYTRGRQKAIESAFKQLEEVILSNQPERPWWKTYLNDIKVVFGGKDKLEV